MKNHFILALIGAFFAIFTGPTTLMAAEGSNPSELDSTKIVETVAPTELDKNVEKNSSGTTNNQVNNNEAENEERLPNNAVFANEEENDTISPSISIMGRTLSIVNVSSTEIDSGDHVNRCGNKFLYAHNISSAFGVLKSLGKGQAFSVYENDETRNYSVQEIVTFEKNGDKLQLNGSGDFMAGVSNARFKSESFDLALMTCAGEPLGNGDATHCLVIFANEY